MIYFNNMKFSKSFIYFVFILNLIQTISMFVFMALSFVDSGKDLPVPPISYFFDFFGLFTLPVYVMTMVYQSLMGILVFSLLNISNIFFSIIILQDRNILNHRQKAVVILGFILSAIWLVLQYQAFAAL